uniref:Uncharacterized protein n=1 Tax=Cacopsylla melanoneura TaxID=428564 RepID=A0A8D8R5T1_9HEMI
MSLKWCLLVGVRGTTTEFFELFRMSFKFSKSMTQKIFISAFYRGSAAKLFKNSFMFLGITYKVNINKHEQFKIKTKNRNKMAILLCQMNKVSNKNMLLNVVSELPSVVPALDIRL